MPESKFSQIFGAAKAWRAEALRRAEHNRKNRGFEGKIADIFGIIRFIVGFVFLIIAILVVYAFSQIS